MKADHCEANVEFENYQAPGHLALVPLCRITGCGENQCSSVTQMRISTALAGPRSPSANPKLSS